MADRYGDWGITSLALPPLGCGNGGLEWSDVWPLMDNYRGELTIEIEVWVPDEEDADDPPTSDELQLDLFSE
ncbi:MAG: hypothetical protein CMJ44_16315 [Pimelobacter sp.]|nr:hypothetical protein [Pimelobacter sp.]